MELLLQDIIHSAAARYPDRVAASRGDRVVTFAEVSAATDRVAAALLRRGVRPGDRVGWWAENTLDAIPFYFGIAQVGAIFAPVSPRATKQEADAVMAKADPALVIVDEGHEGDVTFDALLAGAPSSGVAMPQLDERLTHALFFTSGTTGEPKGVELSHRVDRLRSLERVPVTPRGGTVILLPQFHMGAWHESLVAWAAGEEAVYADGGDVSGVLDAIHRRRAYRIYAIPAVWRRLLEADRSEVDLSCLRIADTGTSAASAELLAAIHEALPATRTSFGYGSTEAGCVAKLGFEDIPHKPGSVGPPAPGVFVRVEDGELLVRSPFLFSGYFRNPEATAEALVDGWYRTGELVEVDDDGYLSIVGRVKDLIRTGGEWVAPDEVDLVLQAHPAIADAAVAGVPDEDWGQVVTAFVVVRPGQTVDLDDLRRHCGERLARHKHPRRLLEVESLPRTGATGQVQRQHLVALAQRATAAGTPT
ncbi:MAG: hypothetical protein JWO68_3196 [Actinomycetia bacterium]|nr:hypothetical protein [Actinomycetes bacterium]